MAGTISQTSSRAPTRGFYVITLLLTSHTDGTVTGNVTGLRGEIRKLQFAPGAGGLQPDDLFDVTLSDSLGIDVMAGGGGNISNAAVTDLPIPSYSAPLCFENNDTFAISANGMGSANTCTVRIFVERK